MRIIDAFSNHSIHVQIFTDSLNANDLICDLKESLPATVSIGHHVPSIEPVLSDFFSISLYPILVRPESNFSFMAAKVGNPILEIFPVKVHKESNTCSISCFYTNVEFKIF